MSDDAHEVQCLITEGDRAGQWDAIGGNATPLEVATARRAELYDGDRENTFRVVPFGTGPNPRVGDVRLDGAILRPDGGWCYMDSGELPSLAVLVTAEQAANAERFGWRRTGTKREGLVQVAR